MIERAKYMTLEEEKKMKSEIHSQVLKLKDTLENKDSFCKKDDWKRMEFVIEKDEDEST